MDVGIFSCGFLVAFLRLDKSGKAEACDKTLKTLGCKASYLPRFEIGPCFVSSSLDIAAFEVYIENLRKTC
jgi:hypothetical protein